MIELNLLARKWRCSAATGSAGLASKSFDHVACPSCQSSPALYAGKTECDVAISASQVLEGPMITAAAAPGWISWAGCGQLLMFRYLRNSILIDLLPKLFPPGFRERERTQA
jgi:hypothetical protein